jgi:hypothetical protein
VDERVFLGMAAFLQPDEPSANLSRSECHDAIILKKHANTILTRNMEKARPRKIGESHTIHMAIPMATFTGCGFSSNMQAVRGRGRGGGVDGSGGGALRFIRLK